MGKDTEYQAISEIEGAVGFRSPIRSEMTRIPVGPNGLWRRAGTFLGESRASRHAIDDASAMGMCAASTCSSFGVRIECEVITQ